MPWELQYEAAFPAAPNPVPVKLDEASSEDSSRHLVGAALNLPGGCYFLQVFPLSLGDNGESFVEGDFRYEGTLRVEWDGLNLLGSGDLYSYRAVEKDEPILDPPWSVDPRAGIPIFPRKLYRYYVRLTGAALVRDQEGNLLFRLTLDLLRFSFDAEAWVLDETLTVDAGSATPAGREILPRPPGKARPIRLEGPARNPRGNQVATVKAIWVSTYLRRAKLMLYYSQGVDLPESNGRSLDWQGVYDQVGWKMDVDRSTITNEKKIWSEDALHAFMLGTRQGVSAEGPGSSAPAMDEEWRYFLLCVPRIARFAGLDEDDQPVIQFPFGIMYDDGAYDDDGIPREGAAIAAEAILPDEEAYGGCKGLPLGKCPEAYFRTAVHEMGHAQNLAHNPLSAGFMQQTRQTARAILQAGKSSKDGRTFPDGIPWYFAPDDVHRLRHMPDPWVRPGGIAFLQNFRAAAGPEEDWIEEAQGVSVSLEPLDPVLPLGAPLRLKLEVSGEPNGVTNTAVPANISLKSANLRGKVVDSSGIERPFSPAVVFQAFETSLFELKDDRRISLDLTLLRGRSGALLPAPGRYEVQVEVIWDTKGEQVRKLRLAASAGVLVFGPDADDEHARGALEVLSAPEIMQFLVFHKKLPSSKANPEERRRGQKALGAALRSDVLAPHFAGIVLDGLLVDPDQNAVQDAEECLAKVENLRLTLSEVQRLLRRLNPPVKGTEALAPKASIPPLDATVALRKTLDGHRTRLLDERERAR